ncbi:MAG: glycosyltransferase family 4 protein [Thermoguttaceae bacterium]|jgi:glycosyltransferase involved in cell wall biosynthesis
MRIMEITSGTGVNGAVRYCLLLTRELVRRGHQLTVVCRPGSWIAEQMAAEPVEVVLSDLHRWPTDELRRIAAITRERGIEMVHTHMSRAHFFGVLLRWFSGVPCVATAHSRFIQLHWMFNDMVIAVSEATRRYHQTHNFVRRNRIMTIESFIEPRDIPQLTPEARRQIRGDLGLDDTHLLVGTIGNVVPRKGQLYLVRALPQVLTANPSVRLILVGSREDVPYTAQVEAEAGALGVADRIIWTGHHERPTDLLSAMDACVLASLEESLPLALLEAMAAGLPVVATAVGGVSECLIHGQTGLLVRPGSSQALAEALIELLADPVRCRQFGEAGRQRILEHFSCEGQTTAIETAFQHVLQRRAA